MSHPFLHPKAKVLLKRVAQAFCEQDAFILQDSNIVFVCGGPMDDGRNMRPQFCKYARTELKDFRIFLAEDAQKDYVLHIEPEFHNIAEFEKIIGEVSTCVILFPESPGSFAELGYFAGIDKLRRKLLIVSNAALQGRDSFIALGPIDRADADSKFKKAIQLPYSHKSKFDLVKERLDERVPSHNRKRFRAQQYRDLTIQQKFYSVFEIIFLFQAVEFEAVEYVFRSIWTNANRTEIHQLLSILVAADYVRRGGQERNYFCVNREARSFFELKGLNVKGFKMRVLDFYEEHYPEVAEIVREL
jgi:hypothetical protein